MNKFIKFCKRPLMTISCTMFAISLICLIVVLSLSHGSFYVGVDDSDKDIIMKYELTLSGEDLTFKTYQNGELADIYTNKFKVYNGKIMEFRNTDTYESFLGLDINSLKCMPDPEIGGIKCNLTCTANNVIMITSIALMSVSIVAFSLSLFVCLITKKPHKKHK